MFQAPRNARVFPIQYILCASALACRFGPWAVETLSWLCNQIEASSARTMGEIGSRRITDTRTDELKVRIRLARSPVLHISAVKPRGGWMLALPKTEHAQKAGLAASRIASTWMDSECVRHNLPFWRRLKLLGSWIRHLRRMPRFHTPSTYQLIPRIVTASRLVDHAISMPGHE
jgi:hypothetical protein